VRVEDRTTFVLPGRWWTLKTEGSEAQMVASIKSEVERTVGREDDRASLRRELRTQLLGAARKAQALGADRLYLAEEITDGVPFAASLTVVKAAMEPLVEGTVSERASALATLAPPNVAAEVCDFVEYPLVRTVEEDGGAEPDSVPVIKVDYLLASPYTGEVMIFAFGCALVPIRNQVIELFDAILTTVSFPETARSGAD
jgi:hypothetical protein